MTNFNDWINLELQPMAAIDHLEEFTGLVRERLSKDIERQVKGSLDPGVDPKRAIELNALNVKVEGSTFVIKTDDSMKALAFAEGSVKDGTGPSEARSVESLFEMSSGVPEVRDGKLVYKTISLEALFGAHEQRQQDEQVQRIVEDTIREKLPDAYDEAFAEVKRRHP